MMKGRFRQFALIRMKDGRCYWGWVEETRVATGWFLSVANSEEDTADRFLNAGDVAEMTPKTAEELDEFDVRFPEQPANIPQ